MDAQQAERLESRLLAHEIWRNGRLSYRVDEEPDYLRVSNEERSALEVYNFANNAYDKYFAYINETTHKLTTWTGETLGDLNFGREYHVWSFGTRTTRQSIRVHAINGLWYSGIYYKSSGNYARITLTAKKGW